MFVPRIARSCKTCVVMELAMIYMSSLTCTMTVQIISNIKLIVLASIKYNMTIQPGMTFTIEPIITQGYNSLQQWDDGWTLATADCGRAAQFEEMIAIGKNGNVVILSRQ